jgi:hypothetical protein
VTTELILLLGLFGFILGGAFMGDKGPRKVFSQAAPKLGARVEQNISFGHRFRFRNGSSVEWAKPDGAPPLGNP